MKDKTAVTVSSLSKKYKMYASPMAHVTEALFPGKAPRHEALWALQNVSFSVRKGESFGIIGVNGSGKSTLLQIICGVLKATEGEFSVAGRITGLLELGAGLSYESTGRENIYLQGALMGMSRQETETLLPAVVQFAEIGDFIDRPVKTYSSGMLMRLAISIAFQFTPDVLIVDEALAVGDVFFQAKCINKLHQMREAGTTLLFVSHDMGLVRTLCDRALLLDNGCVIMKGAVTETVEKYYSLRAEQLGAVDLGEAPACVEAASAAEYEEAEAERSAKQVSADEGDISGEPHVEAGEKQVNVEKRYGNGKGAIEAYSVNSKGQCREIAVASGGLLDISLDVTVRTYIANPFVAVMLRTWQGFELFGNNTTFANTPIGSVDSGDRMRVSFSQELHLNNGQYLLTLTLAEWGENGEVVYVDRCVDAVLVIVENGPFPYAGVCNLNGSITVEKKQ